MAIQDPISCPPLPQPSPLPPPLSQCISTTRNYWWWPAHPHPFPFCAHARAVPSVGRPLLFPPSSSPEAQRRICVPDFSPVAPSVPPHCPVIICVPVSPPHCDLLQGGTMRLSSWHRTGSRGDVVSVPAELKRPQPSPAWPAEWQKASSVLPISQVDPPREIRSLKLPPVVHPSPGPSV